MRGTAKSHCKGHGFREENYSWPFSQSTTKDIVVINNNSCITSFDKKNSHIPVSAKPLRLIIFLSLFGLEALVACFVVKQHLDEEKCRTVHPEGHVCSASI